MIYKRYCIANWKMNNSMLESKEFILMWNKMKKINDNVKTIICPSFTGLQIVGSLLKGSSTDLGAQNIFYKNHGAYTGEISSVMLKELECKWVIIGHSERRNIIGETNEVIHDKLSHVIKEGLYPILCVGETLEQRNNQKTEEIIKEQLDISIGNININKIKYLLIAYEPVWAIGTGLNADNNIISKIHSFIRNYLIENGYNNSNISIIYGGSVTDQNAITISKNPNVDGFLIGGASLDVEKFYSIYNKI